MSDVSVSVGASAGARTINLGERLLHLRRLVLELLTPEDLTGILRALIERAKAGCFQAAKLYLGYIFGRRGPVITDALIDAPIPDAPIPEPEPSAPSVTERVVTAPAPPPPAPIEITPEMEAYLWKPITPEELNDARRTPTFSARPPKANGPDGRRKR